MRIYFVYYFGGVHVFPVAWDIDGQLVSIDVLELLGGSHGFEFYPLDDLDETG